MSAVPSAYQFRYSCGCPCLKTKWLAQGAEKRPELRVKNAFLAGQRVRWIKTHLTPAVVDLSRTTAEDLHASWLMQPQLTMVPWYLKVVGCTGPTLQTKSSTFGDWLDPICVSDQMKSL
eukprot:2901168-Amphidinium_carterae.1